MQKHLSPVIYGPEEGVWVSFHGIPSRIVTTGDQTDGALCVSVGKAEPGGQAPPHSHRFGEGFYLTKGKMNFTAGNQSVEITEGGFIHIPGDIAHFPKNQTGEEAELITICAPAGFDAFQLEVGERVAGPEGPFPKAGPDTEERMKAMGAKFGIDLDPTQEEFEKDPSLTIRGNNDGSTLAVVGDVYRFLATSEDTGGSYAAWHATVYPGGGPPPHTHRNEEEVFFVLKGEVTIFDDGTPVSAKAGSCAVLPRGTRHWFKNEGDNPAEMLVLVAPAGLEEMFQHTGHPWSSEKGEPGSPPPEEIETLKRLAPSYGIELG